MEPEPLLHAPGELVALQRERLPRQLEHHRLCPPVPRRPPAPTPCADRPASPVPSPPPTPGAAPASVVRRAPGPRGSGPGPSGRSRRAAAAAVEQHVTLEAPAPLGRAPSPVPPRPFPPGACSEPLRPAKAAGRGPRYRWRPVHGCAQ